tara:strand:+ start:317 stop:952 length:636 start_codon:yes stop_codon:yes gene_type:complete
MNKDRIKELKRVKASELIPNPKNWRTHPIAQKNALSTILDSIGYADAVLARETDDGLMLIDGHMRAELTPEDEIPVLVLDINEQESDLLLATHDPISAMAGKDDLILKNLLSDITAQSEPLNDLLTELAGKPPEIPDPDSWEDHWKGMPEFEQDDLSPYRSLNIHFRNQEDMDDFAKIMNQQITDKTKSMWHPILIKNNYDDDVYIDEPEL